MWGMHGAVLIFGGLLSLLFTVLFFAGVAYVIVHLVRESNQAQPPPSSSALHVLEERYARGEITREEFTERRAVLTGRAAPPPPPATP